MSEATSRKGISNKNKECRLPTPPPDPRLREEFLSYLAQIKSHENRTSSSRAAAVLTEEAFEHAEKLYRLMEQMLSLRERNALLQRRIRELEQCHHLRRLAIGTEFWPELENDTQMAESVLRTILTDMKSQSRHLNADILGSNSKWTKVKAAFKWERSESAPNTSSSVRNSLVATNGTELLQQLSANSLGDSLGNRTAVINAMPHSPSSMSSNEDSYRANASHSGSDLDEVYQSSDDDDTNHHLSSQRMKKPWIKTRANADSHLNESTAIRNTLTCEHAHRKGGEKYDIKFFRKLEDYQNFKAQPHRTSLEDNLSADFRKKLQEWDRIKQNTSASKSCHSSPRSAKHPAPFEYPVLTDEFKKKLQEWRHIKNTNQYTHTPPSECKENEWFKQEINKIEMKKEKLQKVRRALSETEEKIVQPIRRASAIARFRRRSEKSKDNEDMKKLTSKSKQFLQKTSDFLLNRSKSADSVTAQRFAELNARKPAVSMEHITDHQKPKRLYHSEQILEPFQEHDILEFFPKFDHHVSHVRTVYNEPEKTPIDYTYRSLPMVIPTNLLFVDLIKESSHELSMFVKRETEMRKTHQIIAQKNCVSLIKLKRDNECQMLSMKSIYSKLIKLLKLADDLNGIDEVSKRLLRRRLRTCQKMTNVIHSALRQRNIYEFSEKETNSCTIINKILPQLRQQLNEHWFKKEFQLVEQEQTPANVTIPVICTMLPLTQQDQAIAPARRTKRRDTCYISNRLQPSNLENNLVTGRDIMREDNYGKEYTHISHSNNSLDAKPTLKTPKPSRSERVKAKLHTVEFYSVPSSPTACRRPIKEICPNIRIMLEKYNEKVHQQVSKCSTSNESSSSNVWQSPLLERRVRTQTERYQGELSKNNASNSVTNPKYEPARVRQQKLHAAKAAFLASPTPCPMIRTPCQKPSEPIANKGSVLKSASTGMIDSSADLKDSERTSRQSSRQENNIPNQIYQKMEHSQENVTNKFRTIFCNNKNKRKKENAVMALCRQTLLLNLEDSIVDRVVSAKSENNICLECEKITL